MSRAALPHQSVLFLHIPKAAGTTLHRIIDRQYDPERIHTLDGQDTHGAIEAFKKLPPAVREQIACLKGHMPFGLHAYLPQPCTYITLLRDPVERIASHYYYVLRRPNHYLHDQVASRGLSLRDYALSALSDELINGQTRLVAGIDGDDDTMLAAARRNLETWFAVVGVVERFDESLLLMKRRLGWRQPYYERANVTEGRPTTHHIPSDAVQAIREVNRLDMQLYDHAVRLLDEAIRAEGRGFRRDMRQFWLLNTLRGLAGAYGGRAAWRAKGLMVQEANI